MSPVHLRPPYPLLVRSRGHTERGPLYYEIWEWPDRESGWSALSPKFQKNNLPALRDYTGCQPTGYLDPATEQFVTVPEMIPELVVPNLKGFRVSFN
ncbi:unnamed protein product [Soboliphyme baturini]|uniref:Chromo domain-containing protein n=1 Tax=Soboliphyme baturini TaxID=241478 RepID=A0A183IQD3_9BILA|nr:unnamed protein product [Soboliphyme baturini]